jgi:hypothetical protein
MSRTAIFWKIFVTIVSQQQNTLLENIKNANLTSAHLRLFELNLPHK